MAGLLSLVIIACSVALDALSVSVAGGLKTRQATLKDALKVAGMFGFFQAIMPLIGWGIGAALQSTVAHFSNVAACILLSALGLKMLYEAFSEGPGKGVHILETKTLLLLAIATSIDALVVGISLNLIDLPLLLSVFIIGIVTFVLSLIGFLFGKKLGHFFEDKVEVIGGVALILIGFKILLG
jgi:putative Mn2+ efflux pump MntP